MSYLVAAIKVCMELLVEQSLNFQSLHNICTSLCEFADKSFIMLLLLVIV